MAYEVKEEYNSLTQHKPQTWCHKTVETTLQVLITAGDFWKLFDSIQNENNTICTALVKRWMDGQVLLR